MEKLISVRGYEYRVDFDYQPREEMTRHYPGCCEAVEINEVWDSDGDKIKEYAFEFLEDELAEACLNSVCDDQDRAKFDKEESKMAAAEARDELRHEINYRFIRQAAGFGG